jgi:hypothetical protein
MTTTKKPSKTDAMNKRMGHEAMLARDRAAYKRKRTAKIAKEITK